MSKSSKVWEFVNRLSPGEVECIVCETKLSNKDGSTTAIKRHLKRWHSIETDSKSSSSSSALDSKQPKLDVFISKKAKLDKNSPRYIKITSLIRNMITKDLQPFSFTEDIGFRDLLAFLEPRYTMPSRKTFRDSIIPNLYKEVSQKLKTIIRQHAVPTSDSIRNWKPYYSITTDGWTSRTTTSYITYTLHIINSDFKLETFQLGTYEHASSHTAGNLRKHIMKVCKYWEIIPTLTAANDPQPTTSASVESHEYGDEPAICSSEDDTVDVFADDKCNIVITTDNAANISAAVREAGIPHVRCFAHTINLGVQKAVKVIQQPLSRIRRIVNHFHRSSLAAAALKVSATLPIPNQRM